MTIKRFITTLLVCFLFSFFVITALYEVAEAADATNGDFASKIIDQFYDKSSTWASKLQTYALDLFRILLIFEVCWFGIKMALNQSDLKNIFSQFCLMMVFAGFMFSVIKNYPEWSQNLIRGLSQVSGELGGGQITDSPFRVGIQIVNTIISKLSIWSPGNSVGLIIAALVIITCFALITAQVVFIVCEAYIAMNAGIILLGFGGTSILKEYAINMMRYAFSVAFKLFVMQLILGVGISFIEGFEVSTASFEDIFVIIGASIVLLALIHKIPQTVADLINGSNVSSGTGLGAATVAVAGAGGAMLGAATGGARDSIQNVKDAANIANMEGKSGLGKLTSMAGTLRGAHRDATGHTGQKMRTTMQERLQSTKMNNDE